MPRLPQQSVPALRALEAQLATAPPAAIRGHLTRVEGLCLTVEAGIDYPSEWVYQAVTGERGDIRPAQVITGTDLLGGLPVLLQRLCEAAGLQDRDVPGAVSTAALRTRWNISPASLARRRLQGLPALRVRDAKGRATLVFRPASVDAFEAGHQPSLQSAARFSRMRPADRALVLRRAPRYRRCLGWSLNQTAAHLSARLGRSQEAVRQILLKAESRGTRTFGHAPTLGLDEGRILYRASRRGVDIAAMVRRARRSPASVRRAMNLARAELLRQLIDQGRLPPPGPVPDESPLAHRAVGEGLGAPAPANLGEFLATARSRTPPIAAHERARLAAYLTLRRRASSAIAALSRLHPAASDLDRIETDLRWASRLKAELLRAEVRVIVQTIESRTAAPLEHLPRAALTQVLAESIDAASDAVDAMDATRGGRVAGPVALAVDRVVVRWLRGSPLSPSRRAVPISRGDEPMPDWSRRINPWQRWLEPDPRLRPVLAAGRPDAAMARALSARFGFGVRPHTLVEWCAAFDVAPNRAPTIERRAILAALCPQP